MKLDVLAFGAHADDVELGCGGTLILLAARGYRVGVIALTRGEMGTRGDAGIRAREFRASAEIMGLRMHRMLDIPDARIEPAWENKLKVIDEIRAFRPGLVFAPHAIDRHPDHEQASRLVRESAYLAGLKKIDTGRAAFRPRFVVYYQGRFEFPPSFIVDVSGAHDKKMRAIGAYESQFQPSGRPGSESEETPLSRPDFLDGIEIRDRSFGSRIGARYGEPFFVREALRVDDPVALLRSESRTTAG